MGMEVRELLELQQCQFFPHFGVGRWEGGVTGDDLKAKLALRMAPATEE
jgi:hypothetical protein